MATKTGDFATWLKEQMSKRGWNQAELARRSNLSRAQVSRICAGLRSGETACRGIARALGLPFEEVFQRTWLPKVEPDPIIRRLSDLVQALPKSDQRVLLRIAESMVASQAAQQSQSGS